MNPVVLFGLSDGATSPVDPSSLEHKTFPQDPPLASTAEGESNMNGHRDVSTGDVAKSRECIASAEAIVLWRDPWRSIRVLGLGLYLFLCMHQMMAGTLLVQPVTLLLGLALMYLATNVVCNIRARAPISSSSSGDESHQKVDSFEAKELRVYLAVQHLLQAIATWVIPAVASTAVLIHKGLSGRHLVRPVCSLHSSA